MISKVLFWNVPRPPLSGRFRRVCKYIVSVFPVTCVHPLWHERPVAVLLHDPASSGIVGRAYAPLRWQSRSRRFFFSKQRSCICNRCRRRPGSGPKNAGSCGYPRYHVWSVPGVGPTVRGTGERGQRGARHTRVTCRNLGDGNSA